MIPFYNLPGILGQYPGYKPIKDQIVAVLNTCPDLQFVSGKEEKKLDKFPAACVTAKEHSSDFFTIGAGGSNKRVYEHFVRLYFRVDEQNDPDYEDVLESVADEVIAYLEQNMTLKSNSVCDWSIPISGLWGEGEKDTPLRVFEIVVASTIHMIRQ